MGAQVAHQSCRTAAWPNDRRVFNFLRANVTQGVLRHHPDRRYAQRESHILQVPVTQEVDHHVYRSCHLS
jgi:hypothetical protein